MATPTHQKEYITQKQITEPTEISRPISHLPPIIKNSTAIDFKERLNIKPFDPLIALEVLRRLISGQTLVKIIEARVIDAINYQHWKKENTDFAKAIKSAKKMRAEHAVEALLDKALQVKDPKNIGKVSKYIMEIAGLENDDYNVVRNRESVSININNQPTIIADPFDKKADLDIDKYSVVEE